MTAYLIGKLTVADWRWYREYRAVTEPLVAEYGGQYLVRGGEAEKLEGSEVAGDASVVIAFPDREAIRGWYADPRYRAMRDLRARSGVICELAILDGIETPG